MSVRGRSRSPLRAEDEPRYLFIGNLPKEWRYFHIKEFLVEQYLTDIEVIEDMGHIYMLRDSEGHSSGECLVAFDSVQFCQSALKALHGAICEGKKLVVMTDTGKLLPGPRQRVKTKKQQEGYKSNYIPPNKRNQHQQHQLHPTHQSHPGHQQHPAHSAHPANQETRQMDNDSQTYGLSKEFLDSLGIQLPLVNRVFISNLSPEVTESKLREVFSLAGHVVSVKRYQAKGKVMYDHPVEAVQAVSMFHGQSLCNSKMIVQMDKSKIALVLPEGLEGVGEGLGFSGRPMLSVRLTFELQQIRQMLEQANINTNQGPMSTLSVNTNQAQNNPLVTLLQLLGKFDNAATVNLAALLGNANPNIMSNVPSQQTPPTSRFDVPPSALAFAQNPVANVNLMANAQNPLATLQSALANYNSNVGANQQAPRTRFDVPPSALSIAPNAAIAPNVPNPGLNQNWGSGQNDWNNYQNNPQMSQNQPSGYDNGSGYKQNPDDFDVQRLSELNKSEDNMKSSDMLLFQNLPPSVTSKALVNKMREVGELLFAEMTGQGRAVVRFQDVRDAERCVKLYDRSKVDGQVISVKLF